MKKDHLTYTFLKLRNKLHKSAMNFLKNDEDAKDVLQDTFFNLWKAQNIESDNEARNKLFRVLKNLCIDRLRKSPILPLDEIDTESMKVNAFSFEDMDNYESLLTAGLTDVQKLIYSLVVSDGLEYEKVAIQLGMKVEAVRMNMSRARKKIRDNYKKLDR